MRLTELKAGQIATVITIKGNNKLIKRLNEMGLNEGTKITFIRRAPLGDPVEIKVKDFYLALRVKDANNITVALL